MGVVTLENVVPSVQVMVLLPFSKSPSPHVTVSSVPESTGNVVSVFRLFQAGSNSVQDAFGSVSEVCIKNWGRCGGFFDRMFRCFVV